MKNIGSLIASAPDRKGVSHFIRALCRFVWLASAVVSVTCWGITAFAGEASEWTKCPDEKPWILGKRTLPLNSDWLPKTPVWDPTGEQLAFLYASGPKLNGESLVEWLCNRDGDQALPILLGKGRSYLPDQRPVWSPDSRTIAIAHRVNAADNTDLCAVSIVPVETEHGSDEKRVQEIVRAAPREGIPSVMWTPFEKEPVHLLYTDVTRQSATDPQKGRVHLIRISSQSEIVLKVPEEDICRAMWMPNGGAILYVAEVKEGAHNGKELFTAVLNGTQHRQLTYDEDVNENCVTISPSGKSILYRSRKTGGVKIINVLTGKIGKFLNASVDDLAWSAQNELAVSIITRNASNISMYKIKPNLF